MRDQRYQLKSAPLLMSFEFTSEGPKGSIQKIIKYTETTNPDVFNLGFGDKFGDTDDYNDMSISDNKDSVRVLATVPASTYTFTDAYPEKSIFASGSTESRAHYIE
jgi:hypothetical protein